MTNLAEVRKRLESTFSNITLHIDEVEIILAALNSSAAGLVEHKAVILNALLTLHPRNEAHRVRLDAAERAVSALPEQEASND